MVAEVKFLQSSSDVRSMIQTRKKILCIADTVTEADWVTDNAVITLWQFLVSFLCNTEMFVVQYRI